MNFVKRTIALAKENVKHGGRPFACLIVKQGKILAEAVNTVAQTQDPTSHAEINAIRIATAKLGCEHLYDCEFYILAHPCPMCLAAMYYCSPKKVIFITTRDEYKVYYKDDRKYFTLENFYEEINKPWSERAMPMDHQPDSEALEVYQMYNNK
ncbi:Guanine deaminase (Guanase) (Guanine aminase) (Guanine aminohydrolase) (GAH) (GDEase) [Legionella beliardensis]|uniref:Guanine deaminase (Guanase) (Guanine aminase) (Guanine aminohydrolase) (GAH) (GDEase) n=1 Tax=Legionella beliardensis TaxID=91822 RepID=A0A378I2B8_9GAMM|nr:nucleoside deaminase [Legionella beliardensis]STX29319.1 Guanine deaminase (Guanase) (Guanine aminase) (Guanine aminohydrolase) (GAH) (GDEase) [Legionella beliardensis]